MGVAPDTHRALTSKQKMETGPALSLLLLLLLGFSQANSNLVENDVGKEKVNDDITTRILSANKDSSELLLEGDMVLPKTRNAMKCWNDRCLWKKSAGGYVLIPYTISDEFTPAEKSMIVFAMKSSTPELAFALHHFRLKETTSVSSTKVAASPLWGKTAANS